MNNISIKKELLQLSIETYNNFIEIEWQKIKFKKKLYGNLNICEYCGRKYIISCICNDGIKKWNRILSEVKTISEYNNKKN